MEELDETTVTNEEVNYVPFEYDIIRVAQTHTDNNDHLPTTLQSKEWVDDVLKCFDPQDKLIVELVTINCKIILKQVTTLVNILHFRLTSHLDRRLNESPDKKKHWVVD